MQKNDLIYILLLTGLIIALSLSLSLRNRNSRMMRLLALRTQQNNAVNKKLGDAEHENDELKKSFRYASIIHNSFLPSEFLINQCFVNWYKLYEPKDIIGGDFYWLSKFENKAGKTVIYFAFGDATGHGVPGSMLSLLGINFLEQFLFERNLDAPHIILNGMRRKISDHLKSASIEINDGFDMALLKFVPDEDMLYYASGGMKFYKLAGDTITAMHYDNFPVGAHVNNNQTFTLKAEAYTPTDRFVFATDGYFDQFGGKNNKKFMRRNFMALIREIAGVDFITQKEILHHVHQNWKGKNEQTDDVLVFSFNMQPKHEFIKTSVKKVSEPETDSCYVQQ